MYLDNGSSTYPRQELYVIDSRITRECVNDIPKTMCHWHTRIKRERGRHSHTYIKTQHSISYLCVDLYTYVNDCIIFTRVSRQWVIGTPKTMHQLHHIRHVTHSYTWRDAFIYMPWRIHIHAMTRPYTWHDYFMWTPWLLHTDMGWLRLAGSLKW